MSFGRILIAVDGSPESFEAARRGCDLAARLSAQLATVFAAEPPVSISPEFGIPLEDFSKTANREDHAVVSALRRAVHMPPETRHMVRVGHPAEVIVQAAKSWTADLIVVGSHGRGGLHRMLVGSVAESVVRGAPCAVLVIRKGSHHAAAATEQ